MVPFDVYLDVSRASPRVMAHLLEPPGLGIRFESREALDQDLSAAIAEHLRWLAMHGHWQAVDGSPGTAVPDTPRWRIAQEVPVNGNFESGDDVGFYEPDSLPLSSAEVEHYLGIARSARDDLLALARALPTGALDWRYDSRSRTIRSILDHVAYAELWYITRVIDDPALANGMPPQIEAVDRRMDASNDPLARLVMVREEFERFFRGLDTERLSRAVVPTWFCQIQTEQWTARKALRRAIEHEREHTRSVLRTLQVHGYGIT
ncbi:MAG: DinB family protein [Limnochordaceae bacterium]|nr:DinB family protein [Limnochordaceae bacterium]